MGSTLTKTSSEGQPMTDDALTRLRAEWVKRRDIYRQHTDVAAYEVATALDIVIQECDAVLDALRGTPQWAATEGLARAYERLNLCPDHRDKATGRCVVCQAEE